ncbi:hypothetical protein GGS24DRAFT_514418 [Hypoxylon argillaceum]|nr:hypothetical protein GGS24DRAFT_514418 [Hypoxylon argillaceum]
MEQENLQSIPMEVPDPQQVTSETIKPDMQLPKLTNGTLMRTSLSLPSSSVLSSAATAQLEQSQQLSTSRELANREATIANLAQMIYSSLDTHDQRIARQTIQAWGRTKRLSEGTVANRTFPGQVKMPADSHNATHTPYMTEFLAFINLMMFLRDMLGRIPTALLSMASIREKSPGSLVQRGKQTCLRAVLGAGPPKRYGQSSDSAGKGGIYDCDDPVIPDLAVDASL